MHVRGDGQQPPATRHVPTVPTMTCAVDSTRVLLTTRLSKLHHCPLCYWFAADTMQDSSLLLVAFCLLLLPVLVDKNRCPVYIV